MIKENAKRTLVWLYPSDGEERWLSKARIAPIVSILSPAGLRSLIFGLEKKQLILSQKMSGEIRYGLTTIGKALIETEIAGLKVTRTTESGWSLLVFLSPPASDRNFRYLRQLLIQHHWQTISRGVFIYPGVPTESISLTIQRLYAKSVVIVKTAEWLWGDVRLVIGQATSAGQVDDIYSGISREIDRLIGDLLTQKELNHHDKTQISSVFDRLYSTLKLDFTQVFGQKQTFGIGRDLLSKLQLLG